MSDEEEKDVEGDAYMPTDDPAALPGQGDASVDNAETNRFQSRAEAKERAIAEGFDPAGRRLRLFEITERQGQLGEEVRWEIKDWVTKEVILSCGSLMLDDPQFNDFALAEARGQAYAMIRDLTFSHYRDLRGSVMASKQCKDCGEDLQESTKKGNPAGSKTRCWDCDLAFQDKENRLDEQDAKDRGEKLPKKARLDAQVKGLKLTASQHTLIANIEEQLANLSDTFIDSVGSILRQPWDPGSSWEMVEANGVSKLVRKETKLDDEDVQTKHAYRAGQTLVVDAGVVPDEVVVRELLGENRYRVQSNMTHKVFEVDETNLYDQSANDNMFDGPFLNLGDVAKLF